MKFSIIISIVLLISITQLILADNSTSQQQTNEFSSPATTKGKDNHRKLVLPKLFDFLNFKKLFKKSYNSFLEELARQKLFFARTFNAFISYIKYKNYKLDYFLRVNERSDWTPKEIKNTYIPGHILKANFQSLLSTRNKVNNNNNEELIMPVANLDDIKAELSNIQNGYNDLDSTISKEISDELNNLNRKKRSLDNNNNQRRHLTLDDVSPISPEVVTEKPEVRSKTPKSIKSNNNYYQVPELDSFGVDDKRINLSLDNNDIEQINLSSELNGKQYLKSVLKSPNSRTFTATSLNNNNDNNNNNNDNVVYVDHRRSNCFRLPRNQGVCGSCYIFSTISLYEWLYCYYTGDLIEFSEQYLLDCGGLVQPTPLNGCAGGHPYHVSLFVKEFGLELRRNYPYREKQEQCPYEPNTDSKHMGFIKVQNEIGFQAIPLKDLDLILERTPILIGIALGPNFAHYGGGVDDNANCNQEDGHAMLIIGHGKEDGIDYYLFRNSHSISWGEQGYYKLNKKALTMETCAMIEGFASAAVFSKTTNSNYNPNPVLQRNIQHSFQ